MVDLNKEWPEWEDAKGNKYKAGDEVAYASVSGSAAYLRFGKVAKINKVDSKGKPHEVSDFDDGDPFLKSAYDNQPACPIALTGHYWDDPIWINWNERRMDAYQNWSVTRNRITKPSATVSIEGAGTIKNLHNILKVK